MGKTKDATISIPKTDFNSTEITSKVTETGNVSFEGLTAGKWSGVAKFNIDCVDVTATLSVTATGYSDNCDVAVQVGLVDRNSICRN